MHTHVGTLALAPAPRVRTHAQPVAHGPWMCVCVQVRTIIASELEGALQRYDGLLCPAAPTLAYRFGVSAHGI